MLRILIIISIGSAATERNPMLYNSRGFNSSSIQRGDPSGLPFIDAIACKTDSVRRYLAGINGLRRCARSGDE